MHDEDCIAFLQWALPQLHMRWQGFRKVHAQVCKHLARRLQQLQLRHLNDYRAYLQNRPTEWACLDSMCQVTISRFYRDKLMFASLSEAVLPALAHQAITQGRDQFKVWSLGCGSGEEAYTVALIWQLQWQTLYPNLNLRILATDSNPDMGQRLYQACYSYSAIKNLPEGWKEQAFTHQAEQYCLKAQYRQHVHFAQQDIREKLPEENFDLLLCRNLVFTYFEPSLQQRILQQLLLRIYPGGVLVIGIHEQLPKLTADLTEWSPRLRIYRKSDNQ